MARQGKTAEASSRANGGAPQESSQPAGAAPEAQFEFAPLALETLRGAIGRSLGSAQVESANGLRE